MIRQYFYVEHYWEVIVYYDLDYDLLCDVVKDIKAAGFSKAFVRDIIYNMYVKEAKAVTCSNTRNTTSIVIFNQHKDTQDYINSIVHEAEHIKQAMLYAYAVEDKGEPPAYTIGYLVGRMWEVFRSLVCPA